jgi:hypothetical protein
MTSGRASAGRPKAKSERRRKTEMQAAAGAFLVLVALIGVSLNAIFNRDETFPVSAPPAAVVAPASPTVPSASPPAYENVPAAKRKSYTQALTRVDPALTTDPDRHLRQAIQVCYGLYDGLPRKKLLERVARDFSAGGVKVSARSPKARRIYDATARWMCRSTDLKESRSR